MPHTWALRQIKVNRRRSLLIFSSVAYPLDPECSWGSPRTQSSFGFAASRLTVIFEFVDRCPPRCFGSKRHLSCCPPPRWRGCCGPCRHPTPPFDCSAAQQGCCRGPSARPADAVAPCLTREDLKLENKTNRVMSDIYQARTVHLRLLRAILNLSISLIPPPSPSRSTYSSPLSLSSILNSSRACTFSTNSASVVVYYRF